jgi:hypothetical protein
VDSYLLSDLQQYLQQYPAAHYSHNGKEPLLYVVVLLLSLQFRWVGGPLALAAGWEEERQQQLQPSQQQCQLQQATVCAARADKCYPSTRRCACPTSRHPLPPCCRGAVAFLAREAATKDYRLDGVHLAICLHHYGVLDTSAADAGEALNGAGVSTGRRALLPASGCAYGGFRAGIGRPWTALNTGACLQPLLCPD